VCKSSSLGCCILRSFTAYGSSGAELDFSWPRTLERTALLKRGETSREVVFELRRSQSPQTIAEKHASGLAQILKSQIPLNRLSALQERLT
jgi:hypothetical protein